MPVKRKAPAIAILLLVLAAAAVLCRRDDPPRATPAEAPAWAREIHESAKRSGALDVPVAEPLADGAWARAYALCHDLAARPDRPSSCAVRSVFLFATETCAIDFRSLDVRYHQACAIECPDGCFAMDGLFARTVTCDEWRASLAGGEGCRYEVRDGPRLGPDDADGTPDPAERARAQAVIDQRKKLLE